METISCHSNQGLIRLEQKTQLFVPPLPHPPPPPPPAPPSIDAICEI